MKHHPHTHFAEQAHACSVPTGHPVRRHLTAKPRFADAVLSLPSCHAATGALVMVSVVLHHDSSRSILPVSWKQPLCLQVQLNIKGLHLPTCFGPIDSMCENCPPSHLPSQRLLSTTIRQMLSAVRPTLQEFDAAGNFSLQTRNQGLRNFHNIYHHLGPTIERASDRDGP